MSKTCPLCYRYEATVTKQLVPGDDNSLVDVCDACDESFRTQWMKPYTTLYEEQLWPLAPFLTWGFMRKAQHLIRYMHLRTINKETVAEHLWNVAIMAYHIACHYGLDVDKEQLLLVALLHDIGELAVGDIPSPLKKDERVKAALDRAEDEFQKQCLENMGIELVSYNPQDTNDTISRIVKLADHLSAVLYELEEVAAGNLNMVEPLFGSLARAEAWAYHSWEKDAIDRLKEHVRANYNIDATRFVEVMKENG